MWQLRSGRRSWLVAFGAGTVRYASRVEARLRADGRPASPEDVYREMGRRMPKSPYS